MKTTAIVRRSSLNKTSRSFPVYLEEKRAHVIDARRHHLQGRYTMVYVMALDLGSTAEGGDVTVVPIIAVHVLVCRILGALLYCYKMVLLARLTD